MNSIQRNNLVKITKAIFESFVNDPSKANLQCIDNVVTFDCEGAFSMLIIKFTGNVYIYNKLPDGYKIRMGKDKIIIINKFGRLLKDNILFEFNGTFSPVLAVVYTFGLKNFTANIFDRNKLELISQSKTKVEDETLLFLEEGENTRLPIFYTNKIDDDSVKGLYTTKPFEDGYEGFYTYLPSEDVYMTGKRVTNESRPVSRNINKYNSVSAKKRLNKVYSRISRNLAVKGLSSADSKLPVKEVKPKAVPVKTKLKKEKTIKRGGSY